MFFSILISCTKGMYLDAGIIMRNNRKSTFFQKEYEVIDSLKIRNMKLCKIEKSLRPRVLMPSTDKFATAGRIIFNADSLVNHLTISLKNHFENIYDLSKYDGKWESDCEEYTRKNKDKLRIKDDDGYSVDLVFTIEYLTTKNFDVDVSYGPSFYFEDNDKHNVEYLLTIAIYKKGELIYMDNRTYWDVVYSDRGEQLNYVIRKGSIDSLMNKSLKKYYKRNLGYKSSK